MQFTDIFICRPILSVALSTLILLAGIVALSALPMREYPKMESATIIVETSFPGATQNVMQGFVTTPIAQAISTANGIEYLTSTSTQGNSQIKAKLVLNADADRAMTEILAKVQQVKYLLPQRASDPIINKITDGASDVQYLVFMSDKHSIPEISDFISRVAQPMVTSVPGVATTQIRGGQSLAMRLWVNPDKLAARGLTAEDLANALRSNNVQAAPGKLMGADTQFPITVVTDLRSIQDFRDMVIKRSENSVVRLSDVAMVELGGQNYDSTFFSSGTQGVSLAIEPTPDGNPLEIVAGVNALLPDLQRSAPPGLKLFSQFDTASFVNASIEEVIRTLLEAVVIVVIVIFLFLGSMRAVIIPIITIPLSLIGTAALMLAFGFSLNLLTLLAMVLAIGLVVDDAIVVVENIHRHIESGLSPPLAALVGAREIVWPVIGMTITLAAVYAPIGFMGGLTGALFKEFAFTLASAVIVSGIIALVLSPMMSSYLLSSKMAESHLAQRIEYVMASLANVYRKLLGHTLHARSAVLIVCVVVMAGIIVLFLGVQRELAPPEDKGYVFVQTKAPQYANVGYTERYSHDVEKMFRELPDYEASWFTNGTDGQNNGFGGVLVKPWTKRQQTAAEVEATLNVRGMGITGVNVAAFQGAPLPAGSGGLPIQMVVRSPDDFLSLYQAVEGIKSTARDSRLFAFVDSDVAFDSPQARMTINASKAGEMGVTMSAVADTLAILVGENYINRFNWHDRSYDVIAQVSQSQRLSPDNLGGYYVRTQSGKLVQLATIADVQMYPEANRLPQFNQMNAITVSAVLMPGVTMGQAVDYLKRQPLPPGAKIDWLSDSRQFVAEGNQLTISFAFALIVIFLVLAAQYESLRDPLVILVTVPLAICGALIPLWLGYETLNIYTQIGLVTLIGLISKHGILMVSFANDIQKTEHVGPIDAIYKAAVVRMRPVLMTTAAMVAGLVPLLFANGAGAASRFAIGIVVVTGMLMGTLFTLFVLPTIYSLLARDHRVQAVSVRTQELSSKKIGH
ncbi:efflux RND transporter permease subunit [Serratia fonticola]|uniref:efflux RND transporter permease subunit n=1 Tax=Serratia fonticola TaxID=47917 RepID=UPI001AE6E44B|nr:efflux RND transporter permease subunit [Serratia fonticola]MBP1019058.1 efflux RND transporter permease subunit [Serratia fonticola]CAI0829499.1 Efflux pump membrane transporter BepE [Serratia fonticola]